jgi:thiol-disulfide isomerase/thioredoxin
MKAFRILFLSFILLAQKANAQSTNHALEVIDQDYAQAVALAKETGKLLFIDFYTTWCAPCKKLDKLVFQNEAMQEVMGRDFVLLKYDAEKDTVFHLSKKHHVSSYPTALVLNTEGYVVNRKYGFPGEDSATLQKSVLAFTKETSELHGQKKYLRGYSNVIDATKYPAFYNGYVNRTLNKVQPADFEAFFSGKKDFLKEEDFTPLFYFGRNAPSAVADIVLKDKDKYFERYGKLDAEVLFYFLSSVKFAEAIKENSDEKYAAAVDFAKQSLSQGWLDDILPAFEIDRLKAQKKWAEVFSIYEARREKKGMEGDEINYICWDVYRNCDDQNVIAKSIQWMKELTEREAVVAYLDTYAYLLYKAGRKQEAKVIVEKALKIAKEKGEEASSLEKLLEKL